MLVAIFSLVKPYFTILLIELSAGIQPFHICVMNIQCVIHFQKMVKWPQMLTVMMMQMIRQRNYVCIYFR